ncbi:hypothetical protein SCP_1202270 [Sparassis crispa]|uniref:RING-type domain-containing protein n=1 Tax=Sparassis crispa TaxID=139825 RepID=A0A401H0Q4_9APHY|nr:hypothetical protein SCP_1202270 [Sparassis crispa]GBE88001.1 hypothetical protein SCP_1202270 [Sparassis crispa]
MPSPTLHSASASHLSPNATCITHKLTSGPPALTFVPVQNTPHPRKPKKRAADRPRPERRDDDEPRFTTAVPPSSSRRLQTNPPRPRKPAPPPLASSPSRDRLLDVFESPPDYPPPSFQEAISSPSPFFPAVFPSPSIVVSSPDRSPQVSPSTEAATSTVHEQNSAPDSESSSDVSSIEFLSLDSSQGWEADRELGLGLDERVVREFERQRASESVSALATPRPSVPNVALPPSPRTRLRCCSHCGSVCPQDGEDEHANDHGISMHRSPHSRKTTGRSPSDDFDITTPPSSPMTSSPTSILGFSSPWASSVTLSLSSVLSSHKSVPTLKRRESFGLRRLFSKGKDHEITPLRPRSELYDWEVVDPSIAEDDTPVPSRASTERTPNMPSPNTPRSLVYPREKPVPPPSLAFLNRPVRRSQQPGSPISPTSPTSPTSPAQPSLLQRSPMRAAPPPPLVLGEKKSRRVPPPSSPKKTSAHSPLVSPSVIWKTPEQTCEDAERQVSSALSPSTPRTPFSTTSRAFSPTRTQRPSLSTPTPESLKGALPIHSSSQASPFSSSRSQLRLTPVSPLAMERIPSAYSSANATLGSPVTPATPTTPTGHYPGRPLPQLPHESSSPLSASVRLRPPCLEKGHPRPENVAVLPSASPRVSPRQYSNITDLDVLASRLAEQNEGAGDGRTYEDNLLVADVLGPGSPSPSTSEPAQPVAPPANANARPASPFVGRVEEERRRVLKNGTVKVKFSLLGVVVDKCGICLSQFRVEELAVLGATCQHAFHERCLRRWLATSRTCPICRIAISLAEYDALSSRR